MLYPVSYGGLSLFLLAEYVVAACIMATAANGAALRSISARRMDSQPDAIAFVLVFAFTGAFDDHIATLPRADSSIV